MFYNFSIKKQIRTYFSSYDAKGNVILGFTNGRPNIFLFMENAFILLRNIR